MTLVTSEPSASAALGNSSALEMEAIFGAKPFWRACRQNVMKSGGIGTACRICTSSLLNFEMIEAKSDVPSVYPPEGTTFQLCACAVFVTYFWKPAPSTSLGHSPPMTWLVAAGCQTDANR